MVIKQELTPLDYFAPLIVFLCFFVVVLIISVTCILWFCTTEADDVAVFSKVSQFFDLVACSFQLLFFLFSVDSLDVGHTNTLARMTSVPPRKLLIGFDREPEKFEGKSTVVALCTVLYYLTYMT